MVKKLKLINILLLLAIFPVSSLLVKDYLLYRYQPQKAVGAKSTAPLPQPERSINEYAAIVESSAFPTATRRLVAANLPSYDSASKKGGSTIALLNELKLIGTYVGRFSFAVFEKKGDPAQHVFKKGDIVFDAGSLKEIYKEKAVITVGGNDITFEMPVEAPPPGAGAQTGEAFPREASRGTQAPQSVAAAQIQQMPQMPMTRKTGENEWVLDQKAVLASLEDMGKVMTDARLTPRLSNGAVEGYLVTEIKPRGVFDAIGLQNGDILMRVNGYEITSPEKAVQVLSALKGETKIDLDIIRGGQKMNFRYQIR